MSNSIVIDSDCILCNSGTHESRNTAVVHCFTFFLSHNSVKSNVIWSHDLVSNEIASETLSIRLSCSVVCTSFAIVASFRVNYNVWRSISSFEEFFEKSTLIIARSALA